MKILAFVDMHGNLSALKQIEAKAKEADLVICAGDFTVFEQFIDIIMKRFSKIKKPVLIIHGNHESASVVKAYCSLYKNLIFLHKKSVSIKNYTFIGYGGGGFTAIDKGFEKWANKIKIKDKKVILVTHAPPYNTKIDTINKEPCGNKSIRRFIEKAKPILAVSGHLHECKGQDKLNKTLLINPGPSGKIITI